MNNNFYPKWNRVTRYIKAHLKKQIILITLFHIITKLLNISNLFIFLNEGNFKYRMRWLRIRVWNKYKQNNI